jgi:hypothetical protein
MKYCLVPQLADKFKKMLISGEINPEKLNAMTSDSRREFFAKILGENNARNVNSLFESKLLMKNKQLAMINWAKQVTGIKPEVRRDLISRIERMAPEVLSPAGEDSFLADLARTKLGTDVSFDEAKVIVEYSKVVAGTKDALSKAPDDLKLREDYGRSLLDMNEYLNSIAPSKDNIAISVANLPRALMSTLDLSAPFRQGFGMVTTKEFWKGLAPMVSYWNKEKFNRMQAQILGDPLFESARMAGLRTVNLTKELRLQEDAFATMLASKIPGLAASERAYSGFLMKLRFDNYKRMVKLAEMAGEDMKPGSEASKQIAHMINNFTGAGSVGRLEPATPVLNSLMFSPRKVMANMQILNPMTYLNPKTSPTARKEALKRLIGMTSVATGLISMAAFAGYKQETNPTSADFGKVKIGDTRFDVTGGNVSMAILLARLISGQTKSTTSGIVRDLGVDYGANTRGDVAVNFMRNKLSPTASFVADWMYGKDAIGNPFKMTDELKSRIIPMIVADIIDTSSADPTMIFPVAAADMFGFGTQTYTSDINWYNNPGKELTQFKEKVGDKKFVEANDDYNTKVKELMDKLGDNEKYNSLTNEEKLKVVTKEKGEIKDKVFREYNFKYKTLKTPKEKVVNIDIR